MFALHDSKAEAFTPPFCFETTGLAERAVAEQMLQGEGNVAKFPDDYVLYCIGQYDPQTAVVDSHIAVVAPCRTILDAYKRER